MPSATRSTNSKAGVKTPGELLFERYLNDHGIPFEFEPPIAGKSKKPDYHLDWLGETLICEVKDLHSEKPAPSGGVWIDPYKGIRKKINEVRAKFKEYKEHPCVLVLHNVNDWESRTRPYVLYGAMLGDFGLRMPFDERNGRVDTSRARPAFLNGGKMVDPKSRRPQNTTISTIAVLDEYAAPNPEFERAYKSRVSELTRRLGNAPSIDELLTICMGLYERMSPLRDPVPRVRAFDNPDARIALPDGVFDGPCDERFRFNVRRGRIEPVYAGPDAEQPARGTPRNGTDIVRLLDTFTQAIVREFAPERIVLFGSHAHGCANSASDVDLLVIFPGDGDAGHRSLEIRKRLNPGFPLDLITYSAGEIDRRLKLNDPFIREILDNGKKLYESADA